MKTNKFTFRKTTIAACAIAACAVLTVGTVSITSALAVKDSKNTATRTTATSQKQVDTVSSATTSTGNNQSATGGTTTTSLIGVDAAKKAALADAGVTSTNVTYTQAKLDTDNGVQVYDIEFYTTAKKYSYEINATTSKVVEKSIENISQTTTSGSTTTPLTGVDAAKKVALADAGVTAANVTYTKAKLDTDNGVQVYDIEFYTTTKKYSYEINATTSKVVEKSIENISQTTTGSSTTSTLISVDAAKKVALADAGVTAANVTYTKAKLDTEHGVQVYDIEFYTATKKYSYEINASTSNVVEKSAEAISQATTSQTTTNSQYISLSTAKSTAVAHAGFTVESVTFQKAKLDNDDGITVYEIEFYKDSKEYEYSIDAVSGKILESNWEYDD